MLGLLSPFRHLALRTLKTVAKPTAQVIGEPYVRALSKAFTLKQVWNLISVHNKEMTEDEVVETMKTLHKIISPSWAGTKTTSRVPTSHLNSNYFEDLCHRATDLLDKMSPSQLCQLLEFLQSFEVPVSWNVFAQLLLTIDQRLDEFNMYQVTKIDMCLRYLCRENTLQNVLIEKIRKKLAIHLEDELKSKKADSFALDLLSLTRTFRTNAVTKPQDPMVIDLFTAIYGRRKELSCLESKYTLTGISKAFPDLIAYNEKNTVKLANQCLYNVAFSLNQVPEGEFCRIFMGIFYHRQFKYREEWFNKAAEVYKKRFENCKISLMKAVIAVFAKHNHIDLDMLRMYHERIVQSTGNLEKPDFVKAMIALSVVSQFEPNGGWDPLVKIIINFYKSSPSHLQNLPTHSLLKLASCFVHIDKYPQVIFDELSKRLELGPRQLMSQLKWINFNDLLDVNIALHQGKRLTEPVDELKKKIEPLVQTIITRILEKSHESPTSRVVNERSEILAKCLTNMDSLEPAVWTKYGLYIENLIMLGMSSSEKHESETEKSTKSAKFLENIQRRTGSTLISVMLLDSSEVTRHGFTKRACDFRIKAIEELGIVVVPIQISQFSSMEHVDQTYLMDEIERKLSENIRASD